MQATMLALIGRFGYAALAALVFLENVFPPIPSEVILPAAGFFASIGTMTLPGAIVAATVGSLVGAYALFGVGRLLSEERLRRLMGSRPMRTLGFREDDVQTAVGWFRNHGAITVLVCRCVPIVRSLISIPAGTSGMGIGKFSLYTVLGSLVWNAVLCSVGYFAGSAWSQAAANASNAINSATVVVIAAALVAAGAWVVVRVVPSIKAAVRSEGER